MAEALFKRSRDAIITVDEKGYILNINPATKHMFGLNSSKIKGMLLKEILVEKPSPTLHNNHSLYVNEYIPDNHTKLDALAIHSNGNQIPVETTIITIKTDHSLYYIAMLRDVSKQKKINQKLINDLSIAERSNQEKSKFVAVMSHEMRTPLNGILGLHDLLFDTSLDVEQRNYLELAKFSGDALLSLIDGILDFSKIEAGKLDLELQLFNPEDIVNQAVEMLAQKAFMKDITIQSFIDINMAMRIKSDPTRLRQILLNLVSNAIKFTHHGGITVNLLVSKNDPHKIRFEVIDTGIGINPQQQDVLFTEFTQADSSTNRRYGGTGLGLSISKRLVELLGGEIGVNSQLGEGCVFWFTLGLGNIEAESPVIYDVPRNLSSVRILLVDSNPVSSAVLKRQLEAVQMFVVTTTNVNDMTLLLNNYNHHQPNSFNFIIINGLDDEVENFAKNGTVSNRDYKFLLIGDQKKIVLLHAKYSSIFSTVIPQPARRSTLLNRISMLLEKGEDTYQPVPESKDQSRAANNNIRILIAEDNKINQVVTEQQLQKAGYQSKIVVDGEEVLSEIQNVSYTLVLMDLSMPKMDGLEATKKIRKLQKYKKIPIIAMTATALQEEIDMCFQAGMNDYLAKPCRKHELLAMVEKWSSISLTETKLNDRLSSTSNAAISVECANLIDHHILQELANDVTEEMMPEMINLFISETNKRLKIITSAAHQQDVMQITIESHALKSTAATFGAVHLATIFTQLEAQSKLGNINNSLMLVKQVEPILKKTMSALQNSTFMLN
ncbi:MAG: ATP-binding protein [Methylococcales bacterium]